MQEEMGIEPPKKTDAITIESGVDLYLKVWIGRASMTSPKRDGC
jgi:hypothetical protein